jgi:hypothetical protein
MIGRREFIVLLGGAAAGWPLAARAQLAIGRPGKTPRIGILMPGPAAHSAGTLEPFYRGLHDFGFTSSNLATWITGRSDKYVDLQSNQFSRQRGEPIRIPIPVSLLYD